MSAPAKLAALRHLLAERFPTVAVLGGEPVAADRTLRTGIPTIDDATGGLPLGAVTEVVCAAPSCGSHLLLGELLACTRASRTRIALVDGHDSFDPSSFTTDLLPHLLWVRCHGTAEALQAADLLTRDANLGLVVVDLRRAREAELRQTPATQWYRLQRSVETTDVALVVQTPRSSVASAQLRLLLDASHPPSALEDERRTVAHLLAPTLQRQRVRATDRASAA